MMEKSVFGTYENEELNKWYQIYANLYYDYVDSNLNHFFWRNKDIEPIQNCGESETEQAEAYKAEAISIMRYASKSDPCTRMRILKEYPALKDCINGYLYRVESKSSYDDELTIIEKIDEKSLDPDKDMEIEQMSGNCILSVLYFESLEDAMSHSIVTRDKIKFVNVKKEELDELGDETVENKLPF